MKISLKSLFRRSLVLSILVSISIAVNAQYNRFLQNVTVTPYGISSPSGWDEYTGEQNTDSQFSELSSTKTLSHSDILVISTYSSDYSWSVEIIKYLKSHLFETANLTTSSIDLPLMIVQDQDEGSEILEQINFYIKTMSPKVVVFLGTQALNLIDNIHISNPDTQLLLVCGNNYTRQNENFLDSIYWTDDRILSIETVRERTGMTAITIPIYIREEIDMIVNMRPELNIIYIIGGEDQFSKLMCQDVKDYIAENYPRIQTRSITPDRMDDSDLINITKNSDSEKCVAIFSSWVNRKDVINGKSAIMNNLLFTIASQNIPVFTLRDNGWMERSKDIVGGCLSDDKLSFKDMEDLVIRIVDGTPAKEIEPFSTEHMIIKMNYMKMRTFGINISDCPPSTVFIDSPISVIENNPLLAIFYIVIITSVFTLLILVFRFFKKRVDSIKSRENYFLNAMPMTFLEVEPIFSSDGKVRDGLLVGMNKMAKDLLSEESIGKRLSVIYPFSYAEMFDKINMSAGNNKIGAEFSIYNKQADQYLIFIAVTLENGRLGLACIDNSASVKADRMSKEVSKFMKKQQQFLEYLPYSYVVFELIKDKRGKIIDGTVEYYNDYVNQVVKKTDRDIIGFSAKKMWPNLYKNSIDKLNESIKNNQPLSLEAVYSTKYERYYDIVFRITDSEHIGVMLIDRTTEVTSKEVIINTNKELVAAKLRAEASDKAKNSFIHNMSHEIRTPLNAIVGFAQLLSLPDSFISEEEKTQYREYILNSSEMLSMLIDDMLALSDNKADKYRLEISECNCNELCQKANKTVEYRIPDGVRLEFLTEVDNDFTIMSDPKRIQQVLINFLTNASKHTEKGYIRTGISTSMNPGKLTFYVEDTGCGVDPKDAERIFKQFVMLNPGKEGNGLGLHICKDVAKLLHGEVKLDTSYTGGARFVFILNVEGSKA